MNGIKDDDNENIVSGLSEEEIEIFERGDELDVFHRSDQSHSFDAPAGEESFETDFDDEAAYASAMAPTPQGFFSKFFGSAFLSAGLLGVLLVALVVLFLFMPRGADVVKSKDMAQMEKRLVVIEEQIVALQQSMSVKPEMQSSEINQDQIKGRIDNLESDLALKTEKLKKDVDALAAAVSDMSTRKPVEKAAPAKPAPKAAAKAQAKAPAKAQAVKYHTVKAGENLFRIAIKYGLKEEELLKLNGLPKNTIIHPGEKLKVSK